MTDASFVPLPGSERAPLAAFEPAGPLDGTERIEVTLLTRRMAELPRTAAGTPARISRDDLRQQYGSDPADQALVAEVLAGPGTGIEVVSRDPAARRMVLSGTVNALSEVFGTTLSLVTSQGPSGTVTAPVPGPAACRSRPSSTASSWPCSAWTTGPPGPAADPAARPPPRPRAGLLHPAPGRRGLPVPGGHRRHRAARRDHRARRRLRRQRPRRTTSAGLGITPPSVTAVAWTAARTSRARTRTAPTARSCWTSRWPDRWRPARPSWCTSRPTPTRASSTPVTAAAHATPTPDGDQHQLGPVRGLVDRAGPHQPGPGHRRRGRARHHGLRGVRRQRQQRRGHGTAAARDFPASSPHALACGGTSLRSTPQTGAVSSETVWNDGAGQGGRAAAASATCSRCRPGRPAPACRRWPAAARAAACPTWRATPTRRPATRC